MTDVSDVSLGWAVHDQPNPDWKVGSDVTVHLKTQVGWVTLPGRITTLAQRYYRVQVDSLSVVVTDQVQHG